MVGVTACFCTTAFALPRVDGDAPAFRAEDFIETIGVAGSPFDLHGKEGEKKPQFEPEHLFELGPRYYRAFFRIGCQPENRPEHMAAEWKKRGVRPLLLIDPLWAYTLKTDWLNLPADGDYSKMLDELRRFEPGLVSGVEGPNEVNNNFNADFNLKYKGLTDEAAGSKYQQDFYAAMRADPDAKDIPVVMYTAIYTDYSLAPKTAAFDFLNAHPYQGSDVPSSMLYMSMTRAMDILPEGSVVKPFIFTECGYNVELDKANGQGYVGSVRAQGFNSPMLFAEFFRHGVKREFLFSVPNVDGYGLVEDDRVTRRPAWYAIQSFIRLLTDATWDPEALAWKGGRDFTPRALRHRLVDAPPTVHSLCLQKENGHWFLLLWNELRNLKGTEDIQNTEVPVTIAFEKGTPVKPLAQYRQDSGAGAFGATADVPPFADGKLTVSVPSHVVVLELEPASACGAAPAAPELTAEAESEFTAKLIVSMPANAAFASVPVMRMGMHVATIPRGDFAEKDGRLVAEWTDASAWLRPGLAIPFVVRAIAEDGAMGPETMAAARMPLKRCNLVAGDLTLGVDESKPILPGTELNFGCTVVNAGNGSAPLPIAAGETGGFDSRISLNYFVDGDMFGWAGNDGSYALAAGEKKFFPCFASRHADGYRNWRAVAGNHVLKVKVDDLDRIGGETRKMDNIRSRSITVGEYPGKLSFESDCNLWGADLSAEGTLDWKAFTRWPDVGAPRKKGADLIGDAVKTGTGYVDVNPGCLFPLTWGADGTADASKTFDGLWAQEAGNGWSFEVAADDKAERVLTLYLESHTGGWGELSLSLSDDSAPAVVDDTWNLNRSPKWIPIPDTTAIRYVIRFRAAMPDAKLKVTWRLKAEPTAFRSQLRLRAATLR